MVEMKTHGSAVWQGGLKAGKGAISTKSGTLKDCPYGLSSRFEGKPSTNPEELGTAAAAPALAASSFTAPRALSVKATLSRCQGLTANFHRATLVGSGAAAPRIAFFAKKDPKSVKGLPRRSQSAGLRWVLRPPAWR